MSWVAAGVTAGTLAAGYMGSQASQNAADTQAGAANNATGLSRQQFQITQQNLQPFLNTGTASNNYLAQLMGIPGSQAGGRVINGATYDNQDQVKDIWRNDYIQKLAAQGLGPEHVDESAIDRGVNRAWQDATPANATPGGNFGSLLKPFDLEQFQASPAYQFNLDQGRKAIDKAANSRGNYYAPQTLQDISKFSQGLASNEFQNAYNNYNTNMGNIFGRLQSLSGSGQNAAANLGGFGQNFANTAGNNMMSAGNAQAAGQVGSANAWIGGAQQGYNNYVMQQILSRNQAATYPTTPLSGPTGSFDYVPDQRVT